MLIKQTPLGPALVDDASMPRFWASVWSMFREADLAPSTLGQKLAHINALYVHVEEHGQNLDDALSAMDLVTLGSLLESFFVKLRNVPHPNGSTLNRWNTAFHFVRDTLMRLEKNPAKAKPLEAVMGRVNHLDNLYLGLRPYRPKKTFRPKALPRSVVSELLDALQPGSPTNPYRSEATQWRMLAVVSLMLFQGLRRGEALLLPADFLKVERHPRTRDLSFRLSVRNVETEEDPRANAPGIKTQASIRTIPVARQTAEVFQTYSENYRGRVDHGFFLSSVRGLPLSLAGVNKGFDPLTEALSARARAELLDFTGSDRLRPHSLRHTCAVVRMRQMQAADVPTDKAMMNLRSFFGWSKGSTMPLHYAKAALDEQLNESWNDKLDDRLALLRSLPQ